MYDCTVDKLVLSNHLYEMHPLLSEVFQTLWNVKNLGETIQNYILLTAIKGESTQKSSLKAEKIIDVIAYAIVNTFTNTREAGCHKSWTMDWTGL